MRSMAGTGRQMLAQRFLLVFEGPVKSGFFAENGLTVTVTGPRNVTTRKKLDLTAQDRLRSVLCGF
jgi:hypothetical protein